MTQAYDVFGTVVNETESVRNSFKYAGEQYDQETSQYYLRARFYNPTVGRFTQEDVYRDDGLSLYGYVRNNPIIFIDPSGYARINKCSGFDELKKMLGEGNTEDSAFPPRTARAQAEAQKVVDEINKLLEKSDLKMDELGLADKKPNKVISVITHEDGTVSVGLSGREGSMLTETSKKLEAVLNKGLVEKRYIVSDISMPKQLLDRPTNNSGKLIGNPVGVCAEPKVVEAAHNNKSTIEGMDTRWRFSEGNNHNKNIVNADGAPVAASQMGPCKTCEYNVKAYMEYANENKN